MRTTKRIQEMGLWGGFSVCDAHFDLPQHRHDLLWLVPLDRHDQLFLQVDFLSFHLVQKSPVTSFGYRNNRATRCVEIDPVRAPIIKHIFDLYGSGEHSLTTLRKVLIAGTGVKINRAYLENILKNPFYIGRFIWREVEYKGLHSPLITLDQFQRVRDVFTGRHKPRYRKHQFAFAGLLRCAHDGCVITTELQKGRYVYYRCSHGRGKCSLPYMREQDLSDQLGNLLLGIHVPEDIAKRIVESLQAESQSSETRRQEQIAALNQKLATLRTRMDQLYDDKLSGYIDEEFWKRKQGALREHERGLEAHLAAARTAITRESALNVERIFELAKKAHRGIQWNVVSYSNWCY